MDRVRKRPKFGSEHRPAQDQAIELFPDFATVHEAFEAAQVGVWSWDLATDAVNWSSNLAALHGLPPRGFDGSYAGFLKVINEEDRAAVNAALQEAVQKQSGFRTRYRVAHATNFSERWLATSGAVFAEGGAPRRVVGLCYDVTERANLETELRSRIKQQEALAQLGERALAEPDLERLLNDAVSTIALTLNVDFVKILELLPGDTELLLRAGYGWKSDLVGSILTTTAPNSFARATLDSAAPNIVADFDAETRFDVPGYVKVHICKTGVTGSVASSTSAMN